MRHHHLANAHPRHCNPMRFPLIISPKVRGGETAQSWRCFSKVWLAGRSHRDGGGGSGPFGVIRDEVRESRSTTETSRILNSSLSPVSFSFTHHPQKKAGKSRAKGSKNHAQPCSKKNAISKPLANFLGFERAPREHRRGNAASKIFWSCRQEQANDRRQWESQAWWFCRLPLLLLSRCLTKK